jgi:hypothetical protein
MTIVNPLPYTIQNGQAVDAVPVVANFNQIVSNVNANAAPVAGNATQTFAVASATAAEQAVNLGQANSLYAPVAGNAAQTFAVANATANNQAVARGQVLSVSPVKLNGLGGTSANTTYQTSGSFTAPCAGVVIFTGAFNTNSTSAMGGVTLNLYISGTNVAYNTPYSASSWTMFGSLNVAAGASVTVTMQYVVGSTALANPLYMLGVAWFLPQP